MGARPNECVTNKCVACNCSCKKTGGCECYNCRFCEADDDHTRKKS